MRSPPDWRPEDSVPRLRKSRPQKNWRACETSTQPGRPQFARPQPGYPQTVRWQIAPECFRVPPRAPGESQPFAESGPADASCSPAADRENQSFRRPGPHTQPFPQPPAVLAIAQGVKLRVIPAPEAIAPPPSGTVRPRAPALSGLSQSLPLNANRLLAHAGDKGSMNGHQAVLHLAWEPKRHL